MGTPPKKVGHFITKSARTFYYDTLQLHYHSSSEYNEIQKKIENEINIYYFSENSSTFEEIDDWYGLCSDVYYLYDLNQTEKTDKLNFNLLPSEKMLKLYGALDLYNRKDYPGEYDVYLFDLFKEHGLISNYYFTFIYGEYDLEYNYNYLNDDYSNILGNLIIGEGPHELYPDKYKKDDEIKINGIFALDINVIKFKSGISNYSETDVRLNLKYNSEFIKGFQDFAYERGVFNRPFIKYIYAMPPYIIKEEELVKIFDVMKEWLKK